MVSIFVLFIALIVGSSMGFRTSDVKYHHKHHLNRLSRNSEQQQQHLIRNIMGKLIDTETNTIYSIDGQKQQGLPSNTGIMAASMPIDLSTRFIEDLACLEACYKCVEDYPLTTVRCFLCTECVSSLILLFSVRKKQPIIVVQCAIVPTVVLECQLKK